MRPPIVVLSCVALAGLGLACDEFLDFDTLRCGNGVIEPAADEDCDGLPAGSPYRCGPAGTPAACHLLCATSRDCPPRWRCGGAGICTAASGGFARPVATRLDGETIDLADLDGDGRLDVLTNQRDALGVAYGRGDGASSRSTRCRCRARRFGHAVGDADGDGIADVALLDGTGLLLLRGTETRTLEPVVAPEAEVGGVSAVVAVRVAAGATADEVLTLNRTAGGVDFGVRAKALRLEDNMGRLNGRGVPQLRAVQLDPADPSSGEEILLTFSEDALVRVLELSCTNNDCTLALRATLPIADDRAAGMSGAFVADVDLDGWPDVLLLPQGALAVQVAWGGPDGLAPLAPIRGLSVGDRGGPNASLTAVADVGGDARPDLIYAGSLLVTIGEPRAPMVDRAYVPRRPLNRAGVADLDADGRLDIYGLLTGSLEFVLSREDGYYLERSSGFTDIAEVQTGDMDGNRLTDLAIQLTDGAVLVHYGAPDGGFGAPQVIGRFATNAVWTLGRLASDRGVDATDDLVIYADDRLYRFAGSAQQQLTAPIAHMNRPQGVAIGRFADGPGVLVVGRTNDNRRRDSELDAAEVGAADPQLREVGTFGCAPDTQGANATLRVVDWDGDGVNEVVQFDHIDADGEENIAVQWLDVTADAVRCRLIAQVALPGFPLAFDRVDLDGDGNDEVVALVRQPNGPLNVIIWPLDGETPGAPVVIEPELRIEQATVLDLGGGPQWIAIADGALHRTRWVDGALVFTELAPAPRGVVDATTADVDGDGLDDLVLKTSNSVLVLPQTTCSARGAWDGTCGRTEPR